jgi:hypothetical protein
MVGVGGGRGVNPFGIPQVGGAVYAPPPPQVGNQSAYMYNAPAGVMPGGMKRERPADFVTLGPSEKFARAE